VHHACDLLGTFYVDEEVFLLLCMERSFILFPADDMATVVDIRSHARDNATVDGNCLKHVDNSCNLERCFVADNGIYCSEISVGGAARVGAGRLRDPCSLTQVKYLKNGASQGQSYWRRLIGNHTQFVE